jgi:CBS domain-containing protein
MAASKSEGRLPADALPRCGRLVENHDTSRLAPHPAGKRREACFLPRQAATTPENSMLVQDIMSRNVRTVNLDTSLLEVSSLMCLYRLSGLPVVAEGKLVGFVAEKDVLSRMFPTLADFRDGMRGMDFASMEAQYKDVIYLKTADIMATRVISVPPDMHALQAAASMVRYNFRRIPVAVDDTLVGMLSLGDVHKALFHANVSRRG